MGQANFYINFARGKLMESNSVDDKGKRRAAQFRTPVCWCKADIPSFRARWEDGKK